MKPTAHAHENHFMTEAKKTEILEKLRKRKLEILAMLTADAGKVQASHVSKQILAGEFTDCGQATRHSLSVILSSDPCPLAQQALRRLYEA